MGVARSGYGLSILSSIDGVEGLSNGGESRFLDQATGYGISEDIVECVAEAMRSHADADDTAAIALCAILEYLWSGHASVYRSQLGEIFEKWCGDRKERVIDRDLVERLNSEQLMAWLDKDTWYVCRDLSKSSHSVLYYDSVRDAYAIVRMARLEHGVSADLGAWFNGAIASAQKRVSREEIARRASFVDSSGETCAPHEHQIDAVESFCRHRLTVIAGGPGTGKTSMAVCQILRIAFEDEGYKPSDILLAAPTGKAAQRMKEAIRAAALHIDDPEIRKKFESLEGQTLHRILRILPNRLSPYACGEQLRAKLVIIDEVSMMDLPLSALLFRALDPQKTRLVLVGDPNQLPPVNTGEILSNFTQTADCEKLPLNYRNFYGLLRECTTFLTKNYRAKDAPEIVSWQMQMIGLSCEFSGVSRHDEVSAEDNAAVTAHRPKRVSDVRFENVEYCSDLSSSGELLEKWAHFIQTSYEKKYSRTFLSDLNALAEYDASKQEILERFFSHLDSGYRILTPLNSGEFGVSRINDYLMQKLGLNGKYGIPVGCLVMLMENNYRIGHFNGDTGIVVLKNDASSPCEAGTAEAVDARKHRRFVPYVAFPSVGSGDGKKIDLEPLDTLLNSIKPAFAITIHKSQGSEYRHGLVFLPPGMSSLLLSPNLLYTAVSRMKKSVVLMAKESSFRACVQSKRVCDPGLPCPDSIE